MPPNAVMMNIVCRHRRKRKRRGANGRRGSSYKYKTAGRKTGRSAARHVFEDMHGDSSSDDDFASNGQPALVNVMCIVGPTGCGSSNCLCMCGRTLL